METSREAFERVCGVSNQAYWNEAQQEYCWRQHPYVTHLNTQDQWDTWQLALEWRDQQAAGVDRTATPSIVAEAIDTLNQTTEPDEPAVIQEPEVTEDGGIRFGIQTMPEQLSGYMESKNEAKVRSINKIIQHEVIEAFQYYLNEWKLVHQVGMKDEYSVKEIIEDIEDHIERLQEEFNE